jgi:hypothetical protein
MSNSQGLPLFGWLVLAHAGALVLMIAAAVAMGVL